MPPEEFDALPSEQKGRVMRVMQSGAKASKRDFERISAFISPPKAAATKKRESCRVKDLACLEMPQCVEILRAQKSKSMASDNAKKFKLDKEGPVIDVLARHGFMLSDQKLTLDMMKAFIGKNRSHFPQYKSSACKDAQLELLIAAFACDGVGEGRVWVAAAPAALPAPAATASAPVLGP